MRQRAEEVRRLGTGTGAADRTEEIVILELFGLAMQCQLEARLGKVLDNEGCGIAKRQPSTSGLGFGFGKATAKATATRNETHLYPRQRPRKRKLHLVHTS